jgi:Holliday junction DNA helicase RuvA
MIGSIRGTVVDRYGLELLVETSGVGYRLQVTPQTLTSLGEAGDEVFLWVHHHLREDNQTLYGFGSRDERNVFETLIGTHGVGPALGLAILSIHTPAALRLALATDDVGALCLVPGVGKKTAARLLVELKSRLELGDVDLTELSAINGSSHGAAVAPSPHADVRDALVGLGYGPDEVSTALRALPGDGDSSDLLRQALLTLGSN